MSPKPPATEHDIQFMFNPSGDLFTFETPKQSTCMIGTNDTNDKDDEPKDTPLDLDKEWELDPKTLVADMLKYIREGKETQIVAVMPTTKGVEWHIFKSNRSCPNLNHHSNNQYDFLPSIKLEAMIKLWHNLAMLTILTGDKKCFLGEPRIRKILVKVVCQAALPNEKRTVWF